MGELSFTKDQLDQMVESVLQKVKRKYNKSMNQEVRKQVLKRDNYECQLNKFLGAEHLSGMPCTSELEVHHKTYVRYGDEIPEDLVTVCTRCHDFATNYIRGLRFAAQGVDVTKAEEDTAVGVDTERFSDGDPEISYNRHSAFSDAQRAFSRPVGQRRKSAGVSYK